jgi:hypothetical protein
MWRIFIVTSGRTIKFQKYLQAFIAHKVCANDLKKNKAVSRLCNEISQLIACPKYLYHKQKHIRNILQPENWSKYSIK